MVSRMNNTSFSGDESGKTPRYFLWISAACFSRVDENRLRCMDQVVLFRGVRRLFRVRNNDGAPAAEASAHSAIPWASFAAYFALESWGFPQNHGNKMIRRTFFYG